MRASSAEDERPAKKHESALAHVGDADGSVKLPGLLDARLRPSVPLPQAVETDSTETDRKTLAYTPEQEAAAAEAEAAAIAEGLPLIMQYSRREQQSAVNFKHVKWNREYVRKPFQLQAQGKSLGYFHTAQEASLAYSRSIGKEAAQKEAAEARAPPMAVAEVMAAVEAEGLVLVQSICATGFLHVTYGRDKGTYVINQGRNLPCLLGKQQTFESGEEAGLAIARLLGPEASHAAQAAYDRESSRTHLTAEEARAAAAAEELTLVRAHNQSGWLGVGLAVGHNGAPKVGIARYYLYDETASKSVTTDATRYFVTPEEVALEHARKLGPTVSKRKEASFVASCMSKEEAVAAAAAEGLPLLRSSRSKSGFKNVLRCVRISIAGDETVYYEVWNGTKGSATEVHIAVVRCAEVGALLFSRCLGVEQALAEQERLARLEGMTVAEVQEAAAAEGLTLLQSSASTGYYGVRWQDGAKKRCQAAWRGEQFGGYKTPEEAALVLARHFATLPVSQQPGAQALSRPTKEEHQMKEEQKIKRKQDAVVAKEEAKAAAEAMAAEAKAAKAKARAVAIAERDEARRRAKEERQAAAEEAKVREKAWQLERQQTMARQQQQMLRQAAEAAKQQREGAPRQQRDASDPLQDSSRMPPGPAVLTDAMVSVGASNELVEAVLRRATCPRQCLGLESNAPREVARKRYLSLALRLHPDKADHPRAAEAFRAVEAAWRRIDSFLPPD